MKRRVWTGLSGVLLGVLCGLLGSAAAGAATLTVSNAAPAPTEGQLFNGVIATVNDSAGADIAANYTASIRWGDGVEQTAIVTVAGGEVTVSASHTYQEQGGYQLTVSVSDTNHSASGSDTSTVQVADAPLSVPFSTPITFSGAGSASATALASFQAAIGASDNGVTLGEQAAGFRRVGWDQIPMQDGAGQPAIGGGHTVILSSDSQLERGLELLSPLAVSNDGFASVNPGVGGLFTPFSQGNVVAPLNSNAIRLQVVAPASPGSTPIQAVTRGLGLIVLNVTLPNSTSVDYMSGETLLARVFAPVGGHGLPSFVGALFDAPVLTSVVVHLGTAQILSFDGSNASAGSVRDGGTNDLVAADDVLIAEPAADRPTLTASVNVPLTATLGSFQDANPNGVVGEYRATVDWGDGSRSAGQVTAAEGGGGASTPRFTVTATHTYTAAGTFNVRVLVTDLGGASVVLRDTVIVPTQTLIAKTLPVLGPHSSSPSCKLLDSTITRLSKRLLGVPRAHRSPIRSVRLSVGVSCEQSADVRLEATAVVTQPKGHRRSHKTTIRLGRSTAHLQAKAPHTFVLKISRSTLARLTHVTTKPRTAVRLMLWASNAGGRSTVSATIRGLKLR